MREMKDSGVKWIGEIPEKWTVRKVKNIFNVSSGTTPKSDNPSYWDGDIIWITPADFKTKDVYVKTGHRNITEKGFVAAKLSVVPRGSIVFSKRAPIGQVVLTSVELCTNQGCLVAICKDKACTSFYRYAMSVASEEFELFGAGTTFKEISLQAFCNVYMPYTDYNEQRRIANYLDYKCSKIDSIILKLEQIVEKLNVYKTALITEAVTRGVNPCRNIIKTNIGWISEIPSHWTEYRVANLYDQTNESGEESLPILTVSINSGISDRELKDDEQERVFVRSEDRTKYKRVRPGDLVYNMMRAWQGAFGAVRVNGMVSPAYITCRPKKNTQIDSRYIEYLFRTPIAVEEMHRYSHGIADFRLRLYWPEFKNIRLCTPPIQEQTDIADYIDEKCLLIDKLIEKRERLIKKLENYKKSLIFECVTGKKEIPVYIKDVSDTGIKPAVLDQIRDHALKCGIHKVILFGSRARGTFHRDSDIDLAVSGGNIDLFRLAVEEETDTLLAYDVVNLDRTSNEELLDVIRKEGVIIYEEV